MKQIFQLYDFETRKVVGSVLLLTNGVDDVKIIESRWRVFNFLEEHQLNHKDVSDFVSWFNSNEMAHIERVDVGAITIF